MLPKHRSRKCTTHLHLREKHVAISLITLVQKVHSRLFPGLLALSGNIKIMCLCSFKGDFIQGATKAECNMDSLETAQRLADNLTHMMFF